MAARLLCTWWGKCDRPACQRAGRYFRAQGADVHPCNVYKKQEVCMGTAVVLVVLAGIVAMVIRSMVRDKKAGKSLQCGGNCTACGGHCHAQKAPEAR